MKKPKNYYGFAYDSDIVSDKKIFKEYKKQRISRGFDNTELWSLDSTIASFILPRLKYFSKRTNCHPSLISEKEWKDILSKIIRAFELVKSCDAGFPEYKKEYEEGINLFSQYLLHLWY